MEDPVRPSDRALLALIIVVACLAGIGSLIGLVAFLQGSQ